MISRWSPLLLPLGLPRRVPNQHDTVLVAGDVAVDQDQVTVEVYPYHLQVQGGPLRIAQLTRHAHPLVDARGRRGGADRAGLLDVVRAVRDRAAAEVMALVLAGKPLAFRGAGDVDPFAGGKEVGLERLADFIGGSIGLEANLANMAMGGNPSLLEVPGGGLGERLLLDVTETELD